MNNVPQEQLLAWRKALQQEIVGLQLKVSPLMQELAELHEKVKAIDKLIGSVPSNGGRQGDASFAPTHAYWVPILESLEELGGRGEAETVLNSVQQKMRGILTQADLSLLPSGISVRWRNRAQWQRKNMLDQGLLQKDSPRGIWELTEEGRKWLENNRRGNNGR